jgi:hypothetical protein
VRERVQAVGLRLDASERGLRELARRDVTGADERRELERGPEEKILSDPRSVLLEA